MRLTSCNFLENISDKMATGLQYTLWHGIWVDKFQKKTCCLVQILPGIVSKDPQGADVSMQMSEFHGGPWATS